MCGSNSETHANGGTVGKLPAGGQPRFPRRAPGQGLNDASRLVSSAVQDSWAGRWQRRGGDGCVDGTDASVVQDGIQESMANV